MSVSKEARKEAAATIQKLMKDYPDLRKGVISMRVTDVIQFCKVLSTAAEESTLTPGEIQMAFEVSAEIMSESVTPEKMNDPVFQAEFVTSMMTRYEKYFDQTLDKVAKALDSNSEPVPVSSPIPN